MELAQQATADQQAAGGDLVEKVQQLYNELNKDNLGRLAELYDSQVTFRDPLHEIHGLDNLEHYFGNMYERLSESRFEFQEVIASDDKAFLKWRMYYRHRAVNFGREVSFDGITELHFNDKVHYHRDFFDAGAMLYEHLPLLGWSIRTLKRAMKP